METGRTRTQVLCREKVWAYSRQGRRMQKVSPSGLECWRVNRPFCNSAIEQAMRFFSHRQASGDNSPDKSDRELQLTIICGRRLKEIKSLACLILGQAQEMGNLTTLCQNGKLQA